MHHTIVPRVPKVFDTSRLLSGHAEVIPEAGKVSLTLHANAISVRTGSAVVTVCLMVAYLAVLLALTATEPIIPRRIPVEWYRFTWTNHVWAIHGHIYCHFIVESVQNSLVYGRSSLSCGIGQETVKLLIEPIIRIRKITI